MSEAIKKVLFNVDQTSSVTPAEQAQARANIGAIAASDIPAQVNADWDATSGAAAILHKPTIPAAQVNSDWNASSGVSAILNKPTIPAAQVNSDWSASSGVAAILNKPSIPVVYLDYGLYRDTVASAKVDMLASKQVTFTNPQAATDSPGFFVPPFDSDLDANKVLVTGSQGWPEWGAPLFEAVYGTTTYAEVEEAFNAKKVVYCRVPQNGNAVRMAFLAYANPGTSGNFEFQYYRSMNSRTYTNQVDEVYVYKVQNTTSNQWSTTTRYSSYNTKVGNNLTYNISSNNLTLGLTKVRLRDSVHTGYTAPLTTTTYDWDICGGNVRCLIEVTAAPDNNHCSHVAVTLQNKNANQVLDVWAQVFSNIADAQDFYRHPATWMTTSTGSAINTETLSGATSSVGVGVWLPANELTNIAGKLVFDIVYGKNNVAYTGHLEIIRGSKLYVSSQYDSEA